MGKIVISENITLDGVIEDPTGEDGTERGGWFTQIGDRDREEWAKALLDEALAAKALLLGRRSYAYFIARGWPARAGAWANRLRELPKYVVSSSALDGPAWGSATVVRSNALPTLKQQVDGDIVVYGSGRLAHTLIEQDLVDELRLITYPVVVGAGERLFDQMNGLKPLRLVNARPLGDNLAYLSYQR